MALFKDAVNEFDGLSDLLDAQREVLETLEQLAVTQADLFISEIKLLLAGKGQRASPIVPIVSIIEAHCTARRGSCFKRAALHDKYLIN